MIRKDELIDVPERRAIISEFECRTVGNTLKFEGYASIFDKPYEVHGGPSAGGWDEIATQTAFKRTLSEQPDVVLLTNHDGLPLARTRNSRGGAPTLDLSADTTGLLTRSDLDMRDPDVKSIAIKYDRGDLGDMSFAFRVKKQSWSDDENTRSLDEVSLHKGDVSIVTFGANPHTFSSVRALEMLGELRDDQLVELRAMSDQVERAMARLNDVRNAPLTPGEHHADPGYLDADGNPAKDGNGVPRYQIDDKAHAANAASRFAQNKDKYTPAQQEEILGKIHAAEKKFGVGEQNSITITSESRASVGDSFAQAVHDMAVDDGAGCGFEDGDEDGYQNGSLAQAVHDLVAVAAGCSDDTERDSDDTPLESNNLTVKDAPAATSKGNLTLVEAARMRRPDDSPEPLTVAQAKALAQAS